MINVQTHGATYGPRPERANPMLPVSAGDVASQRESSIFVAANVFMWIVLPGVFWGVLAVWLL